MSGEGAVYAAIALAGFCVTYVWRAIGVLLVARLDPEGPVLLWVRAIATALVAALVMRLVVQPAGTLAQTELVIRLLAIVSGILVFWVARRSVAAGVAAAVATVYLGQSLVA